MTRPYVTIDLGKIEHNARVIVDLCRTHGIEVTGVTKCVCGHPEVARAMLRGGVGSIGDSRLENLKRLRSAGIDCPLHLLRVPALSQAEQVVELADLSLNSELVVLEALSRAAERLGRVHEVVLMIDLGDLREGLWPDRLLPWVEDLIAQPGLRLVGLGANLACFAGVVPSPENMQQLLELGRALERRFDLALRWLSGINSSGLEMIAANAMPREINHARIGEAILLGCETTHRRPWPGTFGDAFALYAEIVELQRKPSRPVGERAEDAFGHYPEFPDRGEMLRALVDVGREDVAVEGLSPLDGRLSILGASSGYTALDATGAPELRVGDVLGFSLSYAALLAVMDSPYVDKRPRLTQPDA